MTHCKDIDNLCTACDQKLDESIVRVHGEDTLLPATMEEINDPEAL